MCHHLVCNCFSLTASLITASLITASLITVSLITASLITASLITYYLITAALITSSLITSSLIVVTAMMSVQSSIDDLITDATADTGTMVLFHRQTGTGSGEDGSIRYNTFSTYVPSVMCMSTLGLGFSKVCWFVCLLFFVSFSFKKANECERFSCF